MGDLMADLKALASTGPWEWPSDTEQMLLRVLREGLGGEAELLLAIELAGESTIISDQVADVLLGILKSDRRSQDARAQAALAFGPALEEADTDGFEEPGALLTESKVGEIQDTLHRLYLDQRVSKEVRRRLLEASVRAPREWHPEAVRAAWSSGDDEWRLTAVFSMGYVGGFDAQILEALRSEHPGIQYEAVRAAGGAELDAAWPAVSDLVTAPGVPRDLLLAAIEAVAWIRPEEAVDLLVDLADSEDDEIAVAVGEALDLAESLSGFDADDDDLEDAD